MAGRFLRSRDKEFFDTVNKELLGNPQTNKSGIINQEVIAYKVAVYETETNLYGEASSGKRYQNGVKLTCLVTADDFDGTGASAGVNYTTTSSYTSTTSY